MGTPKKVSLTLGNLHAYLTETRKLGKCPCEGRTFDEEGMSLAVFVPEYRLVPVVTHGDPNC